MIAPATLSGRCASGAERGRGRVVHLLPARLFRDMVEIEAYTLKPVRHHPRTAQRRLDASIRGRNYLQKVPRGRKNVVKLMIVCDLSTLLQLGVSANSGRFG